MKKFTAILLTVIMVASLFISCDNSIAPTVTDETVSVSFDEATSRSLTASLEKFEKDKLYWKYAAKKADTTGLNSGATGSYDVNGALWIYGGSADTPTDDGLGSVANFSQGIWDFMLFAYKGIPTGEGEASSTEYKLAYQGEVTGVSLKKGSANTVTVTVSPVASGTGKLELSNAISLKKADGSIYNGDALTKVYTVTALGDTSAISPDERETNVWTLDAGAYKVNVDFVKDGFTYASGSVVATVYSNITTTVSGDLAELVTKAEFDSSINPDVMNKEASSGSVDLGKLNQTDASDVTLKDGKTVEESKVVATVPAAAAAQIIKTVAGNEAPANTTVELALRVDTVSATNTTLELEIGMQATVTKTENNKITQTTHKVTELKDSNGASKISVVTIKLQPGLRNVVVKHNGNDMTDLNTTTGDQGYIYDANSGILTIKTSSFSPFTVTYDAPDFVAKIGDTKYTSLIAAVSAAQDHDTIVLLSDTAGGGIGLYNKPSEGQIKNKNLTIDFNGYTYDVSDGLQGSTGTVSQSFHLENGVSITLKNGKLTSSISNARMLIQNYCNLTLDNMILDATEGNNSIDYVLSNNCGDTVINNSTIIAKEDRHAFDACWAPKNGYPKGAQVTVNNSKVVGIIEYDLWGENDSNTTLATILTINSGEFFGNIVVTGIENPNIVINGGSFTDLDSAIKYATSGAEITLAADVTGKGIGSADGAKVRESLTIDFNGHTYTMNDPAVGSTGTKSQAMHWGTSLGAVTLKNGTFKVAKGTRQVAMAMQNYINFTAENMTFDFTNIPVYKYGDNQYTGADAVYNGLEVPLFNNGRDGYMTLKNTTISMPESSVKGISNDGGEITIEDCDIFGAVVMESANKVVKVKNSRITKGVSPYFNSGYTVKISEADDGYTVYTNQTVVNISNTDELTNAINQNSEVIVKLANAVTYELPGMSDKEVSIIGTKDTVIDMKDKVNQAKSISFEGVTVNFGTENYCGFQQTGKLTYRDCTITGKQFLYADEVEFDNCVFEQDIVDYNVWTYGAKKVLFKDCTFNCAGKSVLIYNEGYNGQTVEFKNCKFNATAQADGKAAIEIDSSRLGNYTYKVIIDQATANSVSGFSKGSVSNNSVWNNKKGNKATVIVAGNTVLSAS